MSAMMLVRRIASPRIGSGSIWVFSSNRWPSHQIVPKTVITVEDKVRIANQVHQVGAIRPGNKNNALTRQINHPVVRIHRDQNNEPACHSNTCLYFSSCHTSHATALEDHDVLLVNVTLDVELFTQWYFHHAHPPNPLGAIQLNIRFRYHSLSHGFIGRS